MSSSLVTELGVAQTSIREKLRRLLDAYWLRPENAFWMTLRSEVLGEHTLTPATVDLGCGDGVFSFLHNGGEFDSCFDVFGSVTGLDHVHDDHEDMFDHVDASYQPTILKAPRSQIGVGVDIKPSMIQRAARLALYDKLVTHDNNKPLPFDEDRFETVYCNCAYWVADIDGFLAEIARVMQPGGRAVLQIKLESMRQYTLEAFRDRLGGRVLDIIGRGRLDTWASLANRSTWERRFAKAGLEIAQATPFITGTHAHIWDIGLRPLAPLLVRMASGLDSQTRSPIKRDWVALFCDLLEPLCDASFQLGSSQGEPGEMQYVLRLR